MLTRPQVGIVGTGFACLVSLACVVPWTYTFSANGIHGEKPAGYRFIFDPPRPEREHVGAGVKIDALRVAIPMAVVVLATATGAVLAGLGRRERGAAAERSPAAGNATGAVAPRPDSGQRLLPAAPVGLPVPPPTHEASGTVQEGVAERGNPFAWGLTALGVFLFVATHARDFIAYPAVSLLGCACWATAFGLPLFLCFRFRKRAGAVVVAAAFALTALYHLAEQSAERLPPAAPEPPSPHGVSGAHNSFPTSASQGPDRPVGRDQTNEAFNKGMELVRGGDYDEAVRQFQEAIRRDSTNAEHHFQCGLARFRQGNAALALADYYEAIHRSPQRAELYHHRGLAWESLQAHEEAKRDFAQARRLDPERFK